MILPLRVKKTWTFSPCLTSGCHHSSSSPLSVSYSSASFSTSLTTTGPCCAGSPSSSLSVSYSSASFSTSLTTTGPCCAASPSSSLSDLDSKSRGKSTPQPMVSPLLHRGPKGSPTPDPMNTLPS